MLIHCVLKILQHFHLYVFKFVDTAAHRLKILLGVESPLFFDIFCLHLLELAIEESCLFETPLFLSDHLSLLKVIGQFALFTLFDLHEHLFLPCSLLLPLVLKRHHFLICSLELHRLLLLPLFLRLSHSLVQLILVTLLYLDPSLQILNLTVLDLLHSDGVVSCLLDFLDELLLFFSKVVDA